MPNLSKRAFHRNPCQSQIRYAFFENDAYHEASMCDIGPGGMAFTTPQPLQPGTELFIQLNGNVDKEMVRDLVDTDLIRGTVMWCHQRTHADQAVFGIGVRFMRNICSRCGQTFSHRELQMTDDYLCLCAHCLEGLRSIKPGRIKESVHNYLIGNVI